MPFSIKSVFLLFSLTLVFNCIKLKQVIGIEGGGCSTNDVTPRGRDPANEPRLRPYVIARPPETYIDRCT